jgi:hypothetical protein
VTSCQVISNKKPKNYDTSKVRALHFAFLHHYASQQPPRAIQAKTDTVYVQTMDTVLARLLLTVGYDAVLRVTVCWSRLGRSHHWLDD